ncbi:chloride channel CLIC-like protein 1 isoform X2 [Petromyzon marinus]|uniref:chloride channel CLIC-like protein 1 isoform X2 n=1 Tax=Petromyzon marinus TaxID=7757 RepID=UPI003F7057FA
MTSRSGSAVRSCWGMGGRKMARAMWLLLTASCVVLACACGVSVAADPPYPDDWLDPMDMVNYNPTTRTMRRGDGKTAGTAQAKDEVLQKLQDELLSVVDELSSCLAQTSAADEDKRCHNELHECRGQRAPDPDSRARSTLTRYLRRLLKEIARVGQPSDSEPELHYDGHFEVRLEDMHALAAFTLESNGGATATASGEFPAHAVSALLERAPVRLRQHDPQRWLWSFANSFGVEAATVAWVLVALLAVVMIVATELWSYVSWLTQMWRFMLVIFFLSIPWTWLHLYKVAFAERQARLILNPPPAQCTGSEPRSWLDSLAEWSRQTFTLQDDPCFAYHRDLIVDPFLEVPPTKALMVTLVTFVLEPAKYFGQALSDFLRATYRNLPLHLQLLATVIIMTCIAGLFWCMAQGRGQPRVRLPMLEDEEPQGPRGAPRLGGRPPPRLRAAPGGRARQREIGARGDPGAQAEAEEEPPLDEEERPDGGGGGGGGDRVQDVEPQPALRRRNVSKREEPGEGRESVGGEWEAVGGGKEAVGGGREAPDGNREPPIKLREAPAKLRDGPGRERERRMEPRDPPGGGAEALGADDGGGGEVGDAAPDAFRSVNYSAPVQETEPVSLGLPVTFGEPKNGPPRRRPLGRRDNGGDDGGDGGDGGSATALARRQSGWSNAVAAARMSGVCAMVNCAP